VEAVGGVLCAVRASVGNVLFVFQMRQDPCAIFSREAPKVDCGVLAQYRLRVKQRMVAVRYAEMYGIKPAARHFGVARRTGACGGSDGGPRYEPPRRRPQALLTML
jgi:hypothetical protein